MKRTSRGFRFIEFKDIYGDTVRIQESSLADQKAVWIFPEKTPSPTTGEFLCGAHLNQNTVDRLVCALHDLGFRTDGAQAFRGRA